jgi:hypothetical protein
MSCSIIFALVSQMQACTILNAQLFFNLIVSPHQFVVCHASLCLIWYQKRKIKATNDWAQVGHGVEFKGLSSDMTEEVSIGGKDRLVAVLEWISRDRTGDF